MSLNFVGESPLYIGNGWGWPHPPDHLKTPNISTEGALSLLPQNSSSTYHWSSKMPPLGSSLRGSRLIIAIRVMKMTESRRRRLHVDRVRLVPLAYIITQANGNGGAASDAISLLSIASKYRCENGRRYHESRLQRWIIHVHDCYFYFNFGLSGATVTEAAFKAAERWEAARRLRSWVRSLPAVFHFNWHWDLVTACCFCCSTTSSTLRLWLRNHRPVTIVRNTIVVLTFCQRILDIGTGIGIWAMCILPNFITKNSDLNFRDMADQYESTEVIGMTSDLSPGQPTFISPNCKFEKSAMLRMNRLSPQIAQI